MEIQLDDEFINFSSAKIVDPVNVCQTENSCNKNLKIMKIEMKNGVIQELEQALCRARFIAPLISVLCLAIGFALTILPYDNIFITKLKFSSKNNDGMESLKFVRPVLNETVLKQIKETVMFAETLFISPLGDAVKARYHSYASKHGTFHLPSMFYNGVTFGITSNNSFNLDYTSQNDLSHDDLLEDILKLQPVPTAIMPRSASNNQSTWYEEGYAVYFSYFDLKKHDKLNEPIEPWKKMLDDILELALEYRQIYVTMWYPHRFGRAHNDDEDVFQEDPHCTSNRHSHKYKVIVQEIVPTRTGLNSIISKMSVWMSELNYSTPTLS